MAKRPAGTDLRKVPLVIDTNMVFAAMIRDGGTRELVLDRGLDLRSPPWLWDEVAARYAWLLAKTGLTEPLLDELLRQIRSRIADIPEAAILAKKDLALKRVQGSDKDGRPPRGGCTRRRRRPVAA